MPNFPQTLYLFYKIFGKKIEITLCCHFANKPDNTKLRRAKANHASLHGTVLIPHFKCHELFVALKPLFCLCL